MKIILQKILAKKYIAVQFWSEEQMVLLIDQPKNHVNKKNSFYRSLKLFFPFLRKNCSKTICSIFFTFAALLRIPWDLKLLKIAPICLPLSAKSRNETFLGINCMATGWGQTQMKGTMSWNRFLSSLFHLSNLYF